MVFALRFFGYALTSVMGPIVAETFEGRHYNAILGVSTVALIGGGGADEDGRRRTRRANVRCSCAPLPVRAGRSGGAVLAQQVSAREPDW